MKFKRTLIFLIAVFFLAVPLLAFSAGLVPCGCLERDASGKCTKEVACSLPCFYVLIHNVINFLLWQISTPLAATALMVAGIMFLFGGSEKTITRGRAILSATLIGLFLAFGAWLIVDMILKGLLRSDSGYLPWNKFPAEGCSQQVQPQPSPPPQSPPQLQPQPSPPPPLPSGTLSDAGARRILIQSSGGKITVNAPAPQTSLEGARQTTITGVLSLWTSCGDCDLVITGGTEGGHAAGTYSHTNGYKLDLRPSPALDQAIYNRIATSCRIPPPSDTTCAGIDGNVYRYETPEHWDVCFQCRP